MKNVRKEQGFAGQKIIVLSRKIITEFLMKDPITRGVYITDIGYYPKALYHYINREKGANQHIIIYCVEGSGWVEIKNKRITIESSQFIMIPAGIPHSYGSDEKDAWTIYWIHFSGNLAGYIVNLVLEQSKSYKPYLGFNENRIRLFEGIYSQLEKGYSVDTLRYINMIFYHFLSSLLYEEKFNNPDTKKEEVVAMTIDMMQKKLNVPFTLEELAGFSNLSTSHFSALFKKETGYPPIEYFNHLKIQKACQHLLFTQMSIKEISFSLGIDDPYYFSRMFSKLMNTSPKHYRNRNRNKT